MFFKSDTKLIQEKTTTEQVIPLLSLVFGLFKGLHGPFESRKFPQFSPLRGIDKRIIKNLRLHGHYGPKDMGYPRPKWDGIDPDNFPQDMLASLLEFFAPSHIGFLFDSVPSTPFHEWFKPKNIALIFNVMIEDAFYENPKESILKLANCLQPEVDFKKLTLEEQKRLKLNQQGPKYGAYSKLKSLSWPTKEQPFAEILFEALHETNGDKENKLGYPPHIIEYIFLTYMWERKKSKIDLKPFYEKLSDEIINHAEVKNIIWEGEGSFYTEIDYLTVEAQYNQNQALSFEAEILFQLGHPYFKDSYPPELGYGVSVIKIDGKWESFSDCGEISLLNYCLMALYDPETKRFNWKKLERFKRDDCIVYEKLVAFFRDVYISPLCDFTQQIRNAWADVLSNLNADSMDEPVKYLKNKCCIAPGLDNMRRVVKKLLRPATALSNVRDEFLALLNLSIYDLWSLQTVVDDSKNLTLIFWNDSDKIFEWHFQKEHFDFNRAMHSKMLPYNSHYTGKFKEYRKYTKSPKISEIENESKFAEDLFRDNLDSIEGKCYALYKIFKFKNKFKNSSFDYIIHQWIEPTGKFFAGWDDFHTNSSLIKVLREDCKLSIDTIFDIPELTATMLSMEVSEHRHFNVKYIMERDIELFNKQGRPAHNNNYTKMTRVLAPTIAKATSHYLDTLIRAGVDQYLREISGASLLHLAYYAGSELIVGLNNLIDKTLSNPLHEKSKDGYTPLDFASISHKYSISPTGKSVELESDPGASKYIEPLSFQSFFKEMMSDVNVKVYGKSYTLSQGS